MPRLSVFGLVLIGCAGELDDPARFAPQPLSTASCDAEAVFRAKCTSCHGAASALGQLSLEGPDLAAKLRDKAASGGPGKLVDPGAPDASVLVTKLAATPPFGGRMPPADALTADETACITSWVRSVASAR